MRKSDRTKLVARMLQGKIDTQGWEFDATAILVEKINGVVNKAVGQYLTDLFHEIDREGVSWVQFAFDASESLTPDETATTILFDLAWDFVYTTDSIGVGDQGLRYRFDLASAVDFLIDGNSEEDGLIHRDEHEPGFIDRIRAISAGLRDLAQKIDDHIA